MKKIKIMESVLMLVTVVVLVWLILEEKNAVAFFSATILIPFQIINFICLQKWIYKSVQTTEEKLEQIDRGNKTLAEFEVEIANTPFLMDIIPLIKHYLSLKINRNNAEIFTKQTELTALQSQINPHFLYNTLDTIRGQAMCDDNIEVAKMIETLASFFRYSISRKGNLVTLRDELNNINNYMRIQQYRFNHRFSMEIVIDDGNTAAYDYYVPRLILQPIVENAIIHGLEEKIEGAQVLIEVDIAEDMIITVSDNGRGMSLKELDELNGRIHSEITGLVEEDKSHGTGIALPNINKRIQLLFGEKYGLNVYSSEGCGTDSGKVFLDNKEVEISSPAKARELGIAMIHQELSSELEMSVAENIYLGREPGRFGMVDYRQLYHQTDELLKNLGIHLNPRTKMKRLRVADQQMVEIAKAISQNARVVIMDEPTSSITDKEVDNLFNMIRNLKSVGVGIIYISHKMDEIFQICDEMTILRDGTYIDTFKASEVNEDILIRSMVGRELGTQFPKKEVPIGETLLEVQHLTRAGEYEDISFKLHKGEILSFTGLVGAGRTELMHSIFGLTKPDSGKLILNGEEVEFKTPRDAIQHGIAYVTEDRKGEGLVLPMSVEKNITIASLRSFVKSGFLQKKKEADVVTQEVASLGIKVARTSMSVKALSGGNQQKVVLAKWMIAGPNVLIFDEPTRGIDVGAKAEIYKIMCDYVSKGNAILMVSSEMPEAMGMSDRMIILSNHRCSGELNRNEFNQEAIAQMQFKFMQGKQ